MHVLQGKLREVNTVSAREAYEQISEEFDRAVKIETIDQHQRQAANRVSLIMWRKLRRYLNGKLPQTGNELRTLFSDDSHGVSGARVSFFIGDRSLDANESITILLSLYQNGRHQWAKKFGGSAELYLRLQKELFGFFPIDMASKKLLATLPNLDLQPVTMRKKPQWDPVTCHWRSPMTSSRPALMKALSLDARPRHHREQKTQIQQFVRSFRGTHKKLERSHLPLNVLTLQREVDMAQQPPWNIHCMVYTYILKPFPLTWSYHDAKRDGFTAVDNLFEGNLPRSSDLKGVLGLAQVASAMRDVIADHKASKKTRLVSREEFGNDLDRLRCLLHGSLLSTWDACTSVMWNKDGRSSVNWLGEHQDRVATVSYFQGLFDMFLASSRMSSTNLDSDLDCQYPQDVVKNSGYPEIDLDDCDALTPTLDLRSKSSYMQFAFIAAGAIFGLLLAFLIFWSKSFTSTSKSNSLNGFCTDSHATTLVETYGDLSTCTQDTVDFLDKIYGPILQWGSLPTSFKSHYDAALPTVRDGTIDTISAFEEVLLQGVHVSEEVVQMSGIRFSLTKSLECG